MTFLKTTKVNVCLALLSLVSLFQLKRIITSVWGDQDESLTGIFFFFLQGPRLLEDLEAGLRGDGHGVESGSCTSPNVTWQSWKVSWNQSAPVFSGLSWKTAAGFSEDWIHLHYKVRLFIFLGKTPAVCISWGNLSEITDPKRTIKSGLRQTVTAGVWHSHLEEER